MSGQRASTDAALDEDLRNEGGCLLLTHLDALLQGASLGGEQRRSDRKLHGHRIPAV